MCLLLRSYSASWWNTGLVPREWANFCQTTARTESLTCSSHWLWSVSQTSSNQQAHRQQLRLHSLFANDQFNHPARKIKQVSACYWQILRLEPNKTKTASTHQQSADSESEGTIDIIDKTEENSLQEPQELPAMKQKTEKFWWAIPIKTL